MNNYHDTTLESAITATLLSVGVWAFLYVVLRQFRGKIDDKHIKGIPLWVASDVWVIVFFIREFL